MMMNPAPALPDQASVVIIGGGAVGSSIAFHLAEAGVPDVVLLERDQLASGSTGKAAGGVRAQFSTPVNVELSVRSLERFEQFPDRPGWEVDFARIGYLFLLTREEEVEDFTRNIELQNAYGVPSELVTPSRARELSPIAAIDDVLAAAYCPADGRLTPDSVVQGYSAGARRHGARIIPHCEVRDVRTESGRVTTVDTTRGSIATDRVICAAGAWAPQIGAMVGIELPVTPVRQQLMFTEQIPNLPRGLPLTVDFTTGFYVHQDGQALIFGMADPNEPAGYSTETSDAWLPSLMAAAENRVPGVAGAGIRGGWAGLYELTEDHNPIIGESAAIGGFMYAAGFSGHGVMHAPAVGEAVRDLYLGRAPLFDLTGFSLERFQSGAVVPERSVI
jgi:sarcosine oxidase, subunit beta